MSSAADRLLFQNSLKEKVKLYEDAFEQRYGYRPSHHQKMDDRNTKRILTELARTRKELKQLKERYHICDVVDTVESVDSGRVAAPWPDASAPASGRIQQPASIEQTVLEIQEVNHQRSFAFRIFDVIKQWTNDMAIRPMKFERAI